MNCVAFSASVNSILNPSTLLLILGSFSIFVPLIVSDLTSNNDKISVITSDRLQITLSMSMGMLFPLTLLYPVNVLRTKFCYQRHAENHCQPVDLLFPIGSLAVNLNILFGAHGYDLGTPACLLQLYMFLYFSFTCSTCF